VAAELHRGIGVGFIDVDVTVESIGRTSFTLRCEVFQSEMRAAVARIVLVNFDYKREEAVPLSSSQPAALEPHLVGQPRPPDSRTAARRAPIRPRR
jgi:acyl-CoA hydrolase